MTKYREILRLKSLGFSERNIALSCGVSRNTVSKALKKADEVNISWPIDFDMTDSVLEEKLFPKDKSAANKRMSDFDYIRKELLRNGVSKKLLWVEYCEECRMNGDNPLMYSQFCYYIQKNEEKRRATMHISRKPKDKPNVEGFVGKISSIWITAALRNEQFFSLAELNAAMKEKLAAYNSRKFEKKEGSRLGLFLGEEKPLLAPLPATPFEICEWKQATV